MNKVFRSLAGLGLLLAAAGTPAAEEKEGVAVTIYNGGYGVVREIRALNIGKDGAVKFTDVAAAIDATTVHFKSLTDPAAKILEQDYQYDLVSADKLLKKYVDKKLDVVTKDGKVYGGTLLSFDAGQLVLQQDKGLAMIQRPDNVRDIQFQALPEGLLTRPTLVWLVATEKAGKHLAEVTYQTGGMNWHSEYVLVLGDEDKAGDLAGWVSVDNKSGKTYQNAKMKFIAGDVRRIQERASRREMNDNVFGKAGGAAPMAEKAFFEYHMYTLPRPSTVADNEVKQLEMFTPARGVALQKKFEHTGGKKVQVYVEFTNSAANKLGLPLPAGKVRVFKEDKDDAALEFVGEEQIDHTPKDEKLRLLVGSAFDIVVEERATISERRDRFSRDGVELKIRNHKKEDIQVLVKKGFGRNWNLTQNSHPNLMKKVDANNVSWDLPVKADGETVLTYTVECTW